jgi:hypothetical protein
VYLEGATSRRYALSRDHQGPRAVLNALERLATGYGSGCVRVRQDLAIAESQLRDYQARLGKPFAHDAYLAGLTALRDQLKAALSGGNSDSEEDDSPSAFGLAEKIKSLKSANTIEAAPQRARQKSSTAEEPVTARIRQRQATSQVQVAASEGITSATLLSDNLQSTWQERIEMERSPNSDEPSR